MRSRLIVLVTCLAFVLVSTCLPGCKESGTGEKAGQPSGKLERPRSLLPKVAPLPPPSERATLAAATGTATGPAATGPEATGAAVTGTAAPATPTDTGGAPAEAAPTDTDNNPPAP